MSLLAAEEAGLADLPVPGEWLVQGGAFGLLLLGIWMILTGRLVPRSTLERAERDCEYWREIAMTAVGHTDQLLPAARITTKVTRALADEVTAAMNDVDQVVTAMRNVPGKAEGDRPEGRP